MHDPGPKQFDYGLAIGGAGEDDAHGIGLWTDGRRQISRHPGIRNRRRHFPGELAVALAEGLKAATEAGRRGIPGQADHSKPLAKALPGPAMVPSFSSSSRPTTAASRTASWLTSADSTSAGET